MLWDLIAFLDDETVKKINERGGLKAIVVSCQFHSCASLENGAGNFQGAFVVKDFFNCKRLLNHERLL